MAACLMFAASLSTAQAEEHTFSLPSDETMALLAQYGQDIATFSVKSDMSGITLAIPNAKVRLWGGPVGKVRNLVIGVPPSAYGEIKFGDPAVALDGGIMLDVGAAMLYMPAVSPTLLPGSAFLRTNLSSCVLKLFPDTSKKNRVR